MNLELDLESTPIIFKIEELDPKSQAIHERAVRRAQTFLVSQAELLESIIEVDQNKTYEKFGLGFLTTYCVQYMGLDGDLAGVLVRIARKSQAVPELRLAVASGDVSISNAKTIASVITTQNQEEWIEKAKTLTKAKLEREVSTVFPLKAKPEKNADGGICSDSRWTHMHHIIPRAQGGKDVAENLITLCSAHHRLWHKRQDR